MPFINAIYNQNNYDIKYSLRFNINDVLEGLFCFNLHEVLRF